MILTTMKMPPTKVPPTKVPPRGNVGGATGLPVHPLHIDAETGSVVSAVYFDAETSSAFIVDGNANQCRHEDEQDPADKALGQ